MKDFQTYLNFDGKTREAMTFYKDCLGGDLFLQTFGETGAGTGEIADRILHLYGLLGNTRHILQMDVGGMPQRLFLRGIELLGTKLLPQIRAALTP